MNNPGQESPDNYALRELRDSVIELNKSTQSSSRVMTILTVVLVILTTIMAIPIVLECYKLITNN